MTTPNPEPQTAAAVVRWLYDAYMQTQKLRIAIGNRLDAVTREADVGPVSRSVAKLYADLTAAERGLVRDMEASLRDHPAMPWLGRVKGVGPTLATKMLGLIGDVTTFDTVSKLWRFAGLAVIDGTRERPVKGEKLHYCIPLKTALYLVAGQFLKCGSPYRKVYDTAREFYANREEAKPEAERWTKGHQHLAALRKMEKLFLAHLWETWRTAVGQPVRVPYVIEKLGHTGYVDPWSMCEPEKTRKAS